MTRFSNHCGSSLRDLKNSDPHFVAISTRVCIFGLACFIFCAQSYETFSEENYINLDFPINLEMILKDSLCFNLYSLLILDDLICNKMVVSDI